MCLLIQLKNSWRILGQDTDYETDMPQHLLNGFCLTLFWNSRVVLRENTMFVDPYDRYII